MQGGLRIHHERAHDFIYSLSITEKKGELIAISVDGDSLHSSIELNKMFRNSFSYLLIGYAFGILVYLGELLSKLN